MSTHPATRIAELERELAGARFAAQQHLQTVEAQAAIIARYSQPILSAGVASEFAELRKLARMAHPGPWRAGATSLMAPETEDDLEIILRASNGNRDVLRQTTRYFAAANPATILRLLDRAALASAPAQPVAAIPEAPSKPTDISARLRKFATGAFQGAHDQEQLLIAAADEIERYYGGMMAWKQTAEKKDADYCREVTKAVDARCAARAAIPEAGQSVLTDEDCMRIIDQSEIAMEGYNYVTLTSLIRLALATMSADAQAKGEQA